MSVSVRFYRKITGVVERNLLESNRGVGQVAEVNRVQKILDR